MYKMLSISSLKTSLSSCSCSSSVLGLLLALLSGVLMTAYSALIKTLQEMDSMQALVVRGLLQLFVMGSMGLYKRLPFIKLKEYKTGFILFLVAFTGGLRILFIFTSYSRLPLGDATTILFCSPVFVMFFSIFMLKEPCGVFRVLASLTLLGGIVLIAKPPLIFSGTDSETYDLVGYSLVLSACLMSALGIVLTKLISKKVAKVVILFYLGLATTLCGTIGLFSFGQPSLPHCWEWCVALIIGLLGLVQQYCLIWAVQLESPARVTIVRQLQIILAFSVQVTLFGVTPSWTDLLGAGLVLITVVTITFQKNLMDCVGNKARVTPGVEVTVETYVNQDMIHCGTADETNENYDAKDSDDNTDDLEEVTSVGGLPSNDKLKSILELPDNILFWTSSPSIKTDLRLRRTSVMW